MDQITPTGHAKAGTWTGTREDPKQQFTDQQLIAMRQRGGTHRWDVRSVKVKVPRAKTSADIMAGRPQEDCFSVVEVECPIIHRGGEKDLVIAPGGDTVSVPNGANRRGRK